MTEETRIKHEIKEYLDKAGWFSFPLVARSWAHKGAPDRIACKNSRVIFIEVKSIHGKISRDQEKFQENITEHGGEYFLIRSVEEFQEKLRGNYGSKNL